VSVLKDYPAAAVVSPDGSAQRDLGRRQMRKEENVQEGTCDLNQLNANREVRADLSNNVMTDSSSGSSHMLEVEQPQLSPSVEMI
jgi:hypothetical protein